MITVSIAIAVSVTVAVPASGTFRAVQYHAEVPETFLLIDVFQFGQHAAIQQAAAYHEDGTVRQFLDNLRVGHDVDGRTVYEDIVVLAAKRPYQGGQLAVLQQFRRVGGDGADGEDMQVVVFLVGNNDFFPVFDTVSQICLLYTSPSPRDRTRSRMPSSA